jgi:hypothetical protein
MKSKNTIPVIREFLFKNDIALLKKSGGVEFIRSFFKIPFPSFVFVILFQPPICLGAKIRRR